ncbi:hypothetical protein Tdes44962_MAKER07572 [Teratosphaeria destructans]|uniref:Uncharacterized protein n=1 Tax=Teratosphaeria destructans TaxID=418781 RepID=A0A9W7SZ98_9PEZI|nr:hypothetical protein Tdes44962_MAKER07572 [Teratosphaeria destructans]
MAVTRIPTTTTISLQVYLAPTTQVVFIGITRLATLVFFALGTTYTLLYLGPDPLVPLHIKALYLLGSTIPVSAAMLSGPCVSAIRLHLPRVMARDKADVMRWANNVPPNTRLTMTYMRFRPWPVKKQFVFRDLRRLVPNSRRLSNLEHIPERNRESMDKHFLYGWWVRRFAGRYWVNMNFSSKDRCEVPGVWEKMWRQIPWAGEKGVAVDEAVVRQREEANRARMPGPRVPPPPLTRQPQVKKAKK